MRLEESQSQSEGTCCTRQFQTIDTILEDAKLDKNDFAGAVQSIFMNKDMASDDLKLLEVDNDTLNYLLEGNSLVIRGSENENAICCSQNKTHSFKVAEISNPLLITVGLIFPDAINKESTERQIITPRVAFISNSYFEIKIMKPIMEKMKYLLELNLYCGVSNENLNENAKKYTVDDFLEIIQSSEDEIYKYLNYIEAFNIDGYWRLLDYDYLTGLIEHILKLIDEKGWSFNEIEVDQLYSELKELYPLAILKQVVKYYFLKNTSDPKLYEIKREKICRHYAEILLKNTLKMRISEFESLWRKCVPSSFEVDMKMLRGLAYAEDIYIFYLNIMDLPDDFNKKLDVLFEKRKKWPMDEIKGFLSDFSGDDSEIGSLLTKNCRSFTQNGVKYFSNK